MTIYTLTVRQINLDGLQRLELHYGPYTLGDYPNAAALIAALPGHGFKVTDLDLDDKE